jgi:hypothetical protein
MQQKWHDVLLLTKNKKFVIFCHKDVHDYADLKNTKDYADLKN